MFERRVLREMAPESARAYTAPWLVVAPFVFLLPSLSFPVAGLAIEYVDLMLLLSTLFSGTAVCGAAGPASAGRGHAGTGLAGMAVAACGVALVRLRPAR